MQMHDIWPLFALSLRTPRLELRVVRDDDLPGLVEAALAGIHDPSRMPFAVPWTDAAPDQFAQSFAAYHWGLRASVAANSATANKWALCFTVLHAGRPIGVQQLDASNFAARRTVESGSWLTSSVHGQGFGTEMRAGLLLFAFDHLGAEWAESSAMEWNAASLAVSRKLGYVDNGLTRVEPRPGEVVNERRVRLSKPDFVRPSWTLDATYPQSVLTQLGVSTG